MNDAPHLEVAASLFACDLQDISDRIVAKSWKTSDAMVRVYQSNAVVRVAIEFAAFLLHALSRSLPPTDRDYLTDFVYSPVVRLCSIEMGRVVVNLLDAGVFNIAVLSGDAVEAETLTTVDSRGDEYREYAVLVAGDLQFQGDAVSHASNAIADLIDPEHSTLARDTAKLFLLQALESLSFSKVSEQVQEVLTLELLSYLRRAQ